MALISRADLLALDWGFLGRPFAPVTSSSSDAPPDFGFLGVPFVAAPTGVATPPPTVTARPVMFSIST